MLKLIRLRSPGNLFRYSGLRFCSRLAEPGEEIPKEVLRGREAVEYKFIKSCPRYLAFNHEGSQLYQFDAESKSIADSDLLQDVQPIPWNDVSEDSTPAEVIAGFQDLWAHCTSTNAHLSSERFDRFVDLFFSKAKDFSINEAMCALQIFARFPLNRKSVQERNYSELLIALDEECTKKAPPLTLEQLFFLNSIWAVVPRVGRTFFAKYAARQFNKFTATMKPEELTQAMFYLNLLKRPLDDIRDFENVFEGKFAELELREIAIICTTFMRLDEHFAKPELRAKFLETLRTRDAREFEELEDAFLVSLFWNLQKSSKLQDGDEMVRILAKLEKATENKCLHIRLMLADIGTRHRIFNPVTMEKLLNDIAADENAIPELRARSLVQLSNMIGIMDITTDSKVEEVVATRLLQETGNRIGDWLSSHGNIISILHSLSMKNIYDLELMEYVLRPDYIHFIYKKNKLLEPDLFKLDGYCRHSLALEYKGNLLSDDYLSKMGQFRTSYLPSEDASRNKVGFLDQISNAVKKAFEFHKFANAAAHFQHADAFVCVNKKTKEIVDISDKYPEPYTGQSIYAKTLIGDRADLEIYAFVAGNTRMLCYQSERFTGILRQKIETLQLLGFTPIVINYQRWRHLSHEERLQLVEDLFDEKFQENRRKDEMTTPT